MANSNSSSGKKYTVQHTMLGSVDPETAANHTKGQIVPADHLGDAATIERHLRNGAISESTKEEIDAAELTKENAANEKALRDAEASGDSEAYIAALEKVTTGNDKTAKQAKQADGSVATNNTDQNQNQNQNQK